MKVRRMVGAVGLVAALAVGVWQVYRVDRPLSELVFAGVAVGLFLIALAPLPQVSPRRQTVVIGLGFLALALGSPSAWLLGAFAGIGSVLLWKAYQAKPGEEEGR